MKVGAGSQEPPQTRRVSGELRARQRQGWTVGWPGTLTSYADPGLASSPAEHLGLDVGLLRAPPHHDPLVAQHQRDLVDRGDLDVVDPRGEVLGEGRHHGRRLPQRLASCIGRGLDPRQAVGRLGVLVEDDALEVEPAQLAADLHGRDRHPLLDLDEDRVGPLPADLGAAHQRQRLRPGSRTSSRSTRASGWPRSSPATARTSAGLSSSVPCTSTCCTASTLENRNSQIAPTTSPTSRRAATTYFQVSQRRAHCRRANARRLRRVGRVRAGALGPCG